MIGEVLFGNPTMLERLIAIAVGAILYQFLILAVILMGVNTSYLRIFSAIILAACLMIPEFKEKVLKGVKLTR